MPKVNLTDRFVAGTKANGERVDYFDEKTAGLALRVSSTHKSWTFHFTSPKDGKRARLTLGTYPATSLAAARTQAVEARGHLDETPPRDPRDVFSGAEASAMTVAMLASSFLEKHVAGQQLRSGDEIARRLNRYTIPIIGSVKLSDLHRRDISRVVDPIMKRGRPIQANRVFETMRAMLRWAVGRGDLDRSPIEGMEKPAAENSRERILTDDEILALWAVLPLALAQSKACQRIVKLCLITGQRVGEVSGMRRDELDLAKRVWSLPPARTKNAQPHTVPLTDMAMDIIRDAMKDAGTGVPYVFPNLDSKGPLPAHAVAKTITRAQKPTKDDPQGRLGVVAWTPHDLRRTALTGLARLGVQPIVIGAVANHLSVTKANVTFAHYVQHDYAREKAEALELWGERLEAIVGGQPTAEIVPLHHRAR